MCLALLWYNFDTQGMNVGGFLMRTLSFWQRVVLYGAIIVPVPTYLYLLHDIPSMADSYFIYVLLGWLVPAFGGFLVSGAAVWREAGVFTMLWFCLNAFRLGFMPILQPWEEWAWTTQPMWLCGVVFAVALYLQIILMVGLAHWRVDRFYRLSETAKIFAALGFFLALIPNLASLLYILGVNFGDCLSCYLARSTGLTLYRLPRVMTFLSDFFFVVGFARTLELIFAGVCFPLLFYVGRPESNQARLWATVTGVVTYVGLRWLTDYFLLEYREILMVTGTPEHFFIVSFALMLAFVFTAALAALLVLRRLDNSTECETE